AETRAVRFDRGPERGVRERVKGLQHALLAQEREDGRVVDVAEYRPVLVDLAQQDLLGGDRDVEDRAGDGEPTVRGAEEDRGDVASATFGLKVPKVRAATATA